MCWLCTFPSSAAPLTLHDLYQLADSQSVVIRLTESALTVAQQGVRQAPNAFLPSLRMDVAGSYIGDAYLLSRGFSAAGTTDVPIA